MWRKVLACGAMDLRVVQRFVGYVLDFIFIVLAWLPSRVIALEFDIGDVVLKQAIHAIEYCYYFDYRIFSN